jgi:hypothetical protein
MNRVNKLFSLSNRFERKIKLAELFNSQAEYTRLKRGFSFIVHGIVPQLTNQTIDNWILKNQSVLNQLSPPIQELNFNLYGHFPNSSYDNINKLLLTKMNSEQVSSISNKLYTQIKFAAKLLPEGNIPDLWIYKIDDSLQKSEVSKDFAHYGFIIEALKSLRPSVMLPQVEEFILENKDQLDKLLKTFQHPPRKLGRGHDGVAFSVGQSMVFKLFNSQGAFDATKDSIESLHNKTVNAKTEAMIYDSGELFIMEEPPLYYLIIEKMKPVAALNDRVQEKINDLMIFIISEFEKTKENKELTKEQLILLGKEIANKYKWNEKQKYQDVKQKDIQQSLNLKSNWLQLFVEEILMKLFYAGKNLVGEDLHMGNLGVTEYGVLRYYDPYI